MGILSYTLQSLSTFLNGILMNQHVLVQNTTNLDKCMSFFPV